MTQTLLFITTPIALLRWPLLTNDELLVSPLLADDLSAERRTLHAPAGQYDAVPLAMKVGNQAKTVVVEGGGPVATAPRNLDGVAGAKVLLVTDTHHLGQSIRNVIRYAQSEPFDFILLQYNRQHMHFFVEAGLKNVGWLPSFMLSPVERPIAERTIDLTFAGQAGGLHPYRRLMLDLLAQRTMAVEHVEGSREVASAAQNNSRVTLNVSLNGDLNLRVFEVLAAGGCLVTDRLSPESGLDLLFRHGEHLTYFHGIDELQAAVQNLLGNPKQAMAISAAGQRQYQWAHRPAHKITQLRTLLERGGIEDEVFNSSSEPRCGAGIARPDVLGRRLACYELLQELHRSRAELIVLFSGSVDEQYITDAIDLPRLQAWVVTANLLPERPLRQFGIAPRVRQVQPIPRSGWWSLFICSAANLSSVDVHQLLAFDQIEALVIVDYIAARDAAKVEALTQRFQLLRAFGSEDPLDYSLVLELPPSSAK